MKKNRIFLLFLLLTPSVIAMDRKSKPPELDLEGSQMWRSVTLSESEVWPIEFTGAADSSHELSREYYHFLLYISNRVDQVEQEIKTHTNPVQANLWKPVSYLWSATKYYARSVETLLKDPESEKLAQGLLDKIKIARGNQSSSEKFVVPLDSETQELATEVRSKIEELCRFYENRKSLPIATQIGYLKEYGQRFRRVEEAVSGSFDL